MCCSVISVTGLTAVGLRWVGRCVGYWFDSSRFEVCCSVISVTGLTAVGLRWVGHRISY